MLQQFLASFDADHIVVSCLGGCSVRSEVESKMRKIASGNPLTGCKDYFQRIVEDEHDQLTLYLFNYCQIRNVGLGISTGDSHFVFRLWPTATPTVQT